MTRMPDVCDRMASVHQSDKEFPAGLEMEEGEFVNGPPGTLGSQQSASNTPGR